MTKICHKGSWTNIKKFGSNSQQGVLMQKATRVFTAIMLIVLMSAANAAAAAKINAVASISAIKGEVLVQKQGAGEWSAAKDGDLLKAGDRVKTGSASSCVIKWSTGNMLKMTAYAAMKIDRMDKNPALGAENASVDMWAGKVYAKVNKMSGSNSSFEVRTPTAIAGVRGTSLSVGIDADGTTDVGCFDGAVEVKSLTGGMPVMLQPGYSTVIKKDSVPEPPREIPQDIREEFKQEGAEIALTLQVISPQGNLAARDKSITATAKTEPGNTAAINGIAATVDDKGMFSATIDLADGDNIIKFEATSPAGNTISQARTVKFDRANSGTTTASATKPTAYTPSANTQTPPAAGSLTLTINSHRDGLILRDSSITINGMASPGAEVFVNGSPASVSSTGAFSANVMLVEGDNSITITASANGTSRTLTRTLKKDSIPPNVFIAQPGSTFKAGTGACSISSGFISCELTGQSEPGVSLTINGKTFNVQPDGSFSHTIDLPLEVQNITIKATDQAGNTSNVVIQRSFDPAIVIDRSAISIISMTASPATITGNQTDSSIISISTFNLYNEPVDGIVTFDTPSIGSLSSQSVTTSGGMAQVTYMAGVTGQQPVHVTIIARSGKIFFPTTILLMPDLPPDNGN